MKRNEKRESVLKSNDEWNEVDRKNIAINAKAVNILYYSIDKKEFYRIFKCKSTYEI